MNHCQHNEAYTCPKCKMCFTWAVGKTGHPLLDLPGLHARAHQLERRNRGNQKQDCLVKKFSSR